MYNNKEEYQLLKGLVTDTNKTNQPKGTYSYALNTVNETAEGDVYYRSNEKGNIKCASTYIPTLGKNFIPIGHINLTKDEVILFLASEDGSNSVIALYKQPCELQVILAEPCLNFSTKHQIKGVWRLRKGCDRVIYFVDGNNPDRCINIDDILSNPDSHSYLDDNGNFDCSLTQISPKVETPCIDYIRTNLAGGSLKLGTYQFAVAIADENLNYTDYFSLTQPIPIINNTAIFDFYKNIGGDPDAQPATNNSIDLTISNLDTRFKYVKIAVLETIGGTTTAYEAVTLEITSSSLDYTYAGLDTNTATQIPIEEVVSSKPVYVTSQTIEQHDQRLIRGNVSSSKIDYDVLQQAACLIGTSYIKKPVRYKDLDNSVISGNYYTDLRTYMADEVYAIGIKALINDGTESPVFHIPGRAKDLDSSRNLIPAVTDFAVDTLQHNRQQPNSNLWDSCLYTITSTTPSGNTEVNLEDVKHLGFTSANFTTLDIGYGVGKVPRWMVFNTAYRTWDTGDPLDVYQGLYSKGQLAYFESSYTYPSSKSCTGKSVYSINDPVTGALIEDLSNTPIRHHKMPDTTLEVHFRNSQNNDVWDEEDYILPLGLEFDLTSFHQYVSNFLPTEQQDKIVGYKIVRSLRSKQNRTIIDKGLAYNNIQFARNGTQYTMQSDFGSMYVKASTSEGTQGTFDVHPFSRNTTTNTPQPTTFYVPSQVPDELAVDDVDIRYDLKTLSFHGPKAKFDREAHHAYVKFEKELWGNYEYWGFFPENVLKEISLRKKINYINKFSGNNYGTPRLTNRLSVAQQFVDPNERTQVTLSREFYNKTQEETYCIEFENNIPDVKEDTSLFGGGPQCSISTNLGFFTGNGFSWNGTDKAHYVAIKNTAPGIYGPISSIIYEDVTNCIITPGQNTAQEFGGDCFISRLGFRRTFLQEYNRPLDAVKFRTLYSEIDFFFVESEINCALRHLDTADNAFCDNFYPYYNKVEEVVDVLYRNDFKKNGDFCAGTDCDPKIACNFFEIGSYCFNIYNYNNDYSKQLDQRPCFPLPMTYDYCSQCLNKYPERLIYSEKSYQESLIDHYRIFLANNYRDIPGHTGEIMDIFKKEDQLFVRTIHSLWGIQTNPQAIKTDQGTVYVGTGEFFEVPPKELVSTKTGFGGGQTRWDLVVTPYGACFADASQGIVFLFANGLEQISSYGNKKWFFKNLPFNITQQVPSFPETLQNNTTSKMGVGLIGVYDPNTNRYILTKKDYKVRTDNGVGQVISVNEDNWTIIVNNTITTYSDPYNTPEVFENKSWTISYDLEQKEWIGWHSYIPNYTFNTQSSLFSFIRTNPYNYIWKHNEGDFQSFYGTVYPHILEFVSNENPRNIKIYDAFSYESQAYKYDDLFEDFLAKENKTFDGIIFYNDNQSTGELTVKVKNNFDPFSSLSFDPSEIQVDNVETKWYMNGIRDMVVQTTPSQPLFSQAWNDTKLQYPIDKVVNSNVINYLKSQFEMERMRDHFMVIRLLLRNPDNHKVVTKYAEVDNNLSMR